MSLLTDLVSYYKFDEASGASIDSHGPNNGTISGATQGGDGLLGSGYDFDGVNDFVTLANEANFDLENNLPHSLSLWMNITDKSANHHPFQKWLSVTGGRWKGYGVTIIDVAATTRWFPEWFVGADVEPGVSHRIYLDVTNTFTYAAWHHLVCTYDGTQLVSGIKAYVDGVNEAGTGLDVGDLAGNTSLHDNAVLMGRQPGGGQPYKGLIDEVGFWKRVLTAAEVTSLYNGGTPLAYAKFRPIARSTRGAVLMS